MPNLLLKLSQHFSFVNTLQTKSAPSDVFKKKIKGLIEFVVISTGGGLGEKKRELFLPVNLLS